MESNLMDEIDCTTFFEQIDDLIEFPPENEPGGVNCGTKDVPSMWNGALREKTDGGSAPPDLFAELFVPYEDIVQLEWLSTFVEESFCGGGGSTNTHFQSPSPVSILDSSSSSSGDTNHLSTQRARTKRPRPPVTSNARAAIQISSSELPPMKKALKPVGLEPKRKNKMGLSSPAKPTTDAHPVPVRKCSHCEITKTPQWRAGPMGPKTLCNACGVRHKSGRLFPEYRPAASPTFLPCLHSNSHKKVMEMRRKIIPKHIATAKTTTTTAGVPKLELVPDCSP